MTRRLRRRWIGAGAIILLACTDTNGPPAPTRLIFTVQPSNVTAGTPISPAVAVAIEDPSGDVVTSARGVVTLTLGGGPGGGALLGATAVSAINGVATFSALSIDRAGTGYALTASAPGLAAATTAPFDVAVIPARLAFTAEPSNTTGGA